MKSCKKGSRIQNRAKLYKTADGAMFLKSYKMMQIEDMDAFNQCQFNVKKLVKMNDKTFAA